MHWSLEKEPQYQCIPVSTWLLLIITPELILQTYIVQGTKCFILFFLNVSLCVSVYLLFLIFIYMTVPGLNSGMQTLSCSMWDLVP